MDGGQLDGSVLEIVLSDLPLPERSPSPPPVRRRSPLPPPPRRRSQSPLGVRRNRRSLSPPYRRGFEQQPVRGGWGTGRGGRDVRPVAPSYGGRPAGRRSPSPRPRGRPLSRSRSPVGRRCVAPLCASGRYSSRPSTDLGRFTQVPQLALTQPEQATQLFALASVQASVRASRYLSLLQMPLADWALDAVLADPTRGRTRARLARAGRSRARSAQPGAHGA